MERVGWAERGRALIGVWPVMLIAVAVVGGIYGGVFTPTEGASVGCIAMLVVGVAQRSLGWAEIGFAHPDGRDLGDVVFIILLGAEVFNGFLALSQLPATAAEIVTQSGLPPYGVIVGLLVFYIILGGVMDELAMILLTLPIFFPIVTALDLGMMPDDVAIWFGILVLMVVGIGLTAPPIGLNVFVVSAIAKDVPILSSVSRCAALRARRRAAPRPGGGLPGTGALAGQPSDLAASIPPRRRRRAPRCRCRCCWCR